MGFRFRRSVKLLPGVRLNFSNSGVSTTLGPRGATLSLGKRGPRANVGLPGTGISYSTGVGGARRQNFAGGGAATGSGTSDLGGCAALGIIIFLIFAVATCAGDKTPAPSSQTNEPTPARAAYVAANRLNCRMVPAAGATVAQKLDRNAEVAVLEEQDGWSKIKHSGQTCWASSEFLSTTRSVLPVAQAFAARGATTREPAQSRPARRSSSRSSRRSSPRLYDSEGCPCSGSRVCIGPRGGRYCITSGGNKRYGV